MKIIHLINDTYQVWDTNETTCWFQGTKDKCKKYIRGMKNVNIVKDYSNVSNDDLIANLEALMDDMTQSLLMDASGELSSIICKGYMVDILPLEEEIQKRGIDLYGYFSDGDDDNDDDGLPF